MSAADWQQMLHSNWVGSNPIARSKSPTLAKWLKTAVSGGMIASETRRERWPVRAQNRLSVTSWLHREAIDGLKVVLKAPPKRGLGVLFA